MKQTIFLLSLCAILCAGCVRDYGTPTTKNYPINGNYTELSVSNAFEVTVSDQVSDVVVTVGELAHERVVVRVNNGKLYVGFKPNTHYNGKAIAVIPANANLRSIDLSGASSFQGDLRCNDVEIELSGASTYQGVVETDELDVELSGASDALIYGLCQNNMDIELSGASTLKAANLNAQSVHGEMSGASNADVTFCTILNVELSGASTLTYGHVMDCPGNPVVNCPTSGGSTVNPRL